MATPWCSTSGSPDRDGLDVIQELRAKANRTLILILTAPGAASTEAWKGSIAAPTTTCSSRSR